MGKKLHITNTIIILGFLISSFILWQKDFPSSLDISLELAAKIYLMFLLGLFLIWAIFIILSFFRTKIENKNYTASAITNIFITVIALLFVASFFGLKASFTEISNLTALGEDLSFVLAFIIEGSLALFLLFAPIILFVSFVVFLTGYFRNKKK